MDIVNDKEGPHECGSPSTEETKSCLIKKLVYDTDSTHFTLFIECVFVFLWS